MDMEVERTPQEQRADHAIWRMAGLSGGARQDFLVELALREPDLHALVVTRLECHKPQYPPDTEQLRSKYGTNPEDADLSMNSVASLAVVLGSVACGMGIVVGLLYWIAR